MIPGKGSQRCDDANFVICLYSLVELACGACGSNITCDEPKTYESAEEGVRVVTPDDVDQLEASREMPIPKASPRDPRPEGSPCLDLPPTVKA